MTVTPVNALLARMARKLEALVWTFDRHFVTMLANQGVGFADALHLTSKPPGAVFVSFDRSFVRRARRAGATEISAIP